MGRGERVVLMVFAPTALGWMIRPQLAAWSGLPVDNAVIAMTGALALHRIAIPLITALIFLHPGLHAP